MQKLSLHQLTILAAHPLRLADAAVGGFDFCSARRRAHERRYDRRRDAQSVVDPQLIKYVQISDGPQKSPASVEKWRTEARTPAKASCPSANSCWTARHLTRLPSRLRPLKCEATPFESECDVFSLEKVIRQSTDAGSLPPTPSVSQLRAHRCHSNNVLRGSQDSANQAESHSPTGLAHQPQ